MLPPRRPAHVPRYACSWHYGYVRNPGTASVGYGAARPGGGSGDRGLGSGLPSWVPAVYRPMIARAAQRWNVGAVLLAAQLRTESNFNPHARSSAGALGIAQFMPGTAQEYGLHDPFDPAAAIDAQARLMRRLLQQFAAVPLALAAYNAGPGAVQACRCAAPYSETRDYVARILALMLGQGDIGGLGAAQLTVRLVR
ncbi:lytic transglycosylase domain-containing protein [Paraconexibacter algicola]|nr:lytic transglycosylase domain-containing protein [Paraconexibacter algicola]